MGLLDGRRGLVFGVANERSIAWAIAKCLTDNGAVCGHAHLPGEKMERRVQKALEAGGMADAWLCPCDASKDEDLDAVFDAARKQFDSLHFVIHSIAFADRQYLQIGNFAETPRAVFNQALDISAYTLAAMARRAKPLMTSGGSIVAMTYYGSEKVIPGYNVMGVAKAALECTARYLAAELGASGIRVNTISAGPLRTLSSMAVGGIDDMFGWVEKKAPLRRNIEAEEVGKTALYLVSDLASGVTGENIYVDAGYNIVGL
jgi:enoyl-[acyl-carrier protein] reductase I